MPVLGQLDCSVRVYDARLNEYGTKYDKHAAQTYVAIPDVSTPFSISLKAKEYIAPGLSAYVYIDGVYQCNNAQGHYDPKKNPRAEFRFLRKEELVSDGKNTGKFIGREWRFEKFNIGEFCKRTGLHISF